MSTAGGFLLDTNVLSETRRVRPDAGVTAFLSKLPSSALYISVLTLGELHQGVEMKRRRDPAAAALLAQWVQMMEDGFADRLLPVNHAVARQWGLWSASGQKVPVVEGLIAATAHCHGCTVVTRNVKDMKATGVALVNPWSGTAGG